MCEPFFLFPEFYGDTKGQAAPVNLNLVTTIYPVDRDSDDNPCDAIAFEFIGQTEHGKANRVLWRYTNDQYRDHALDAILQGLRPGQ